MIIKGTRLGKKYSGHWIFRNISIEIGSNDSLSIVGPNGSGKSTLLQVLIDALTPSEGQVVYSIDGQEIPTERSRHEINFCSPYTELIEELTLDELLQFHGHFKKSDIPFDQMKENMWLTDAGNKPIAQFSSGMKQRVKLGLQFYFQSSIIALDEPTTNLDEQGVKWYRDEIQKIQQEKTILVASNNRYEYDFCQKTLDLAS